MFKHSQRIIKTRDVKEDVDLPELGILINEI